MGPEDSGRRALEKLRKLRVTHYDKLMQILKTHYLIAAETFLLPGVSLPEARQKPSYEGLGALREVFGRVIESYSEFCSRKVRKVR
jgi:hypothetical protein